MRTVRFCIIAIFLSMATFLSVACQTEAPSAQTATAQPATAATGASSATGAPAATGPRQIPKAASDKAVIHGKILQIDTNKPLTVDDGVDVFLAEVLHSADNDLSMSSLDKTTAPHTDTDKDGVFVFSDIAPGEYTIVVRSPISEVVGRSASDLSKDLIFTVAAGETLDLGDVMTKYP